MLQESSTSSPSLLPLPLNLCLWTLIWGLPATESFLAPSCHPKAENLYLLFWLLEMCPVRYLDHIISVLWDHMLAWCASVLTSEVYWFTSYTSSCHQLVNSTLVTIILSEYLGGLHVSASYIVSPSPLTHVLPKESKSGSESHSVMPYSLWPHGLYSSGILQAIIQEWVAFPFPRESFQPRNWIQVSHIAGRFFTRWATQGLCRWCWW